MNVKLLSNLNSLTSENKKLKDKNKSFEIEKSRIEKDFQNQMKILEDGRDVPSKTN